MAKKQKTVTIKVRFRLFTGNDILLIASWDNVNRNEMEDSVISEVQEAYDSKNSFFSPTWGDALISVDGKYLDSKQAWMIPMDKVIAWAVEVK